MRRPSAGTAACPTTSRREGSEALRARAAELDAKRRALAEAPERLGKRG